MTAKQRSVLTSNSMLIHIYMCVCVRVCACACVQISALMPLSCPIGFKTQRSWCTASSTIRTCNYLTDYSRMQLRARNEKSGQKITASAGTKWLRKGKRRHFKHTKTNATPRVAIRQASVGLRSKFSQAIHTQDEPMEVDGRSSPSEDRNGIKCTEIPDIIVHPPSDDDADMERQDEVTVKKQIEAQLMETWTCSLTMSSSKVERAEGSVARRARPRSNCVSGW